MAKPLYAGCTYNCNNGEYFDGLKKTMVMCPYCSAKREEDVRAGVLETDEGKTKNLTKTLGFEVQSAPLAIIGERIIPTSERKIMNTESVTNFIGVLDEVMGLFRLGKNIPTSVCFGLPREGRFDLIAHPLLMAAYKANLEVAPLTSTGTFLRERTLVQSGRNIDGRQEEFYAKYYDSKVLVVVIPSGVSEFELLAGKSIMQERAIKGLPTIFLTTSPESTVNELVGTRYDNEGNRMETEPSNYVARGVFAVYDKNKRGEQSLEQMLESEPKSMSLDEIKSASSGIRSFGN